MTPDEFTSLWGPDDFVRATEAFVDQIPLPSLDKAFLQKAGLPRRPGLELDFSPLEHPLRDLETVAARAGVQPLVAWNRYLVLGGDNASYLCALRDEGQIWAVWPKDRLERFVNRGIPQLAACLLGYRQISRGSDGLDDEAYARDLRRYISRVDERALDGDEHWWTVVVEQAGYGDL
jgi:hypothetical protein